MKSLILIGGGGHCHSCIDVIENQGVYKIEGIVVGCEGNTLPVFDYPILGLDEDLPKLAQKYQSALVTLGQIKSSSARLRLYTSLKVLGFELPFIVSTHAYLSPRSKILSGSIVMHAAVINSNAVVGANCIINTQALVEHDVVIEDHCHISTGVKINGGVFIGEGSFIGSGSVIYHGVKIGRGCIVAAGSIVKNDLPNGVVYRGESK